MIGQRSRVEPIAVTVTRAGLYEVGLLHLAERVHPNRIGAPSCDSTDVPMSVQWQIAKAIYLGHLAAGHRVVQIMGDDYRMGIRCEDCRVISEARIEAEIDDMWEDYVHPASGKRWPDDGRERE